MPHSGISGSTPACGSPKLIAANHALHRFLAPRHPPCALSSLTIKPFADVTAYRLKARIRSKNRKPISGYPKPASFPGCCCLTTKTLRESIFCRRAAFDKALAAVSRLLDELLSISRLQFDYSVFKVPRDESRRGPTSIQTNRFASTFVASWRKWDSNPRPSACKADALPTELFPLAGG